MSTARDEALAALLLEPEKNALLTDFDGSLAEIVVDPSTAEPLPDVVEVLARLSAELGAVAVVSGRPARFLSRFFGQTAGLQLFGLYGLERVRPDGTIEPTSDLDRHRAALRQLAQRVRESLPSAAIEEKDLSVALHWRAHPEHQEPLRLLATELAATFGVTLREAKMSLELLAPGAPDKGWVVRQVASTMRCAAYIGDDLGDLSAFDALDDLSVSGLHAIRIAVTSNEVPRELVARADLCCEGPGQVRKLLLDLAQRLQDGAGKVS